MKRITLLSILALTIFSSSLHAQTATNVSARSLQLLGGTTDITKKITLAAPSTITGTGYTLTLPPDDGAADQVLRTDGSGVLSWVTASGGGSSSITDNGTTLSLGSNMSVTLATGTITTSGNILLTNSGTAGSLSLQGTGSGASTFKSGAQSSTTINYTLPTTQPSANQVLAATSVSGSGPYDVNFGWASEASTVISGNTTNDLGATSGGTSTEYLYPLGLSISSNVESLFGTAPSTMICNKAGTIKNFYVQLETAPGGTHTRTFTIRVANANTTITLTITGAATSGSDLAHSASVAANDKISIIEVCTDIGTGIPALSQAAWSFGIY